MHYKFCCCCLFVEREGEQLSTGVSASFEHQLLFHPHTRTLYSRDRKREKRPNRSPHKEEHGIGELSQVKLAPHCRQQKQQQKQCTSFASYRDRLAIKRVITNDVLQAACTCTYQCNFSALRGNFKRLDCTSRTLVHCTKRPAGDPNA